MFRSLTALVVAADAARIEHHLNIAVNVSEDKGALIKVYDGSKCLAVYGENVDSARAEQIFAEKCDDDKESQIWKHENGALKNVDNPGKCLDISEGNCNEGTDLILYPCNGGKNQQFQFANNPKRLTSTKCTNQCVDVDLSSPINRVGIWSCKTGDNTNQKMDWEAEWSLAEQEEVVEEEVEDASSDSEETGLHFDSWTGTIKGYRGLCVDIYSPEGKSEGTREVGTNIVSWPCHGGANQQWKYENLQIINTASGMCLDISENKCKDDQNLIAWKCNGQKNQQWSIAPNGQIKSKKCSKKCVDIDLASNTKDKDLYNVLLWSCKSTSDKVNQQWTVGGR